MTAKRLYRRLVIAAWILGGGWLGWALYEQFFDRDPLVLEVESAERHFSDGRYRESFSVYEELERERPEHPQMLRGMARSLMQLGENKRALELYDRAIKQDSEFAVAYLNRAVLLDRMGLFKAAIADYEKAAELDASIDEGPGWLTRFLRNQSEKQPTASQRAQYLRQQIALPEGERELHRPEEDSKQHSYRP